MAQPLNWNLASPLLLLHQFYHCHHEKEKWTRQLHVFVEPVFLYDSVLCCVFGDGKAIRKTVLGNGGESDDDAKNDEKNDEKKSACYCCGAESDEKDASWMSY